jgi:cytochrome c peroxidase
MRLHHRVLTTSATALLCLCTTVHADDETLKDLTPPVPNRIFKYVQSRDAAEALGKALFWDEQTGGDGIQACATCHFSAGGDTRDLNQVNPHGVGASGNGTFDIVGGSSEAVTAADFPITGDDVMGSQGVESKSFDGLSGTSEDLGTSTPDPDFGTDRRTTGRNTPVVINAIFERLQFHDGRASDVFNGVDPSGTANKTAKIYQLTKRGKLARKRFRLKPASLASQAVGPPNNGTEMSWEGRSFPQLGRKLIGLQPLAQQEIAADDSVFEGFVDNLSESGSVGMGLTVSYDDLIRAAFFPKFWASTDTVDGFTQMELNFSMFWGLSILIYEASLVSDDSPFDTATMTAQQLAGEEVFDDNNCDNCHRPPEFTEASMLNGGSDDFAYIGVRPISEDPGRGDGEIKTPSLRNVELSGPYMHNGGFATLRQVVEFYDRGGDFPNSEIDPLGLSESEKVALVDFLLALTDERVRIQAAPFDHPQLHVPNGPTLPAVGRTGGASLPTFLGLHPQTP